MRRVHVPSIAPGLLPLESREAHHLLSVLRMKAGDAVELFDDAGATAPAALVESEGRLCAHVDTGAITQAAPGGVVVASAVPKGDRADWMVEKLSELGAAALIPLRTARSVVHPEGAGKLDRWKRIATEAAKQSHRSGVMRIDPLTPLNDLLASRDTSTEAIVLSTRPPADPLIRVRLLPGKTALLLVGPEGGWSSEELAGFDNAGLTAATLGPTILRIETAAVVGAGVIAARHAGGAAFAPA